MFRRPPRSTLFPYTTLFRSEKIQLAKPAAARLGAGDVFDLREQMRDGCLVRAAGEAEENFVGILQRSEEHTSELQSQFHLVCRLLLEKKKLSVAKEDAAQHV